MLRNRCPWTAAAIACQEHALRALGTAHEARRFADDIDQHFEGTRAAAAQASLTDRSDAEALAWASEFFTFAAQHPEAYAAFRQALEDGKPADFAGRVGLRADTRTVPSGGSACQVIDLVRRGRL